MILNEAGLKDKQQWQAKGYALPAFDREKAKAQAAQAPVWLHFGAGNIFRAFLANAAQKLLNSGDLSAGLIVAEGYDYEIIEKMNRPHDDYSILVTLKADGNVEKTVIGSIAESCILDSGRPAEFERLKAIFAAPSLQMASFTITEKGYSLENSRGERLPEVAADMAAGPAQPQSYMGKVAGLLHHRFCQEAQPLAMVSMDNCSHNGDKLYAAIHALAEAWEQAGLAKPGFLQYVEDKKQVSFPWTMIDKITPRPDASVEAILKADGVLEPAPITTGKKTYVAPFVNAEECEYLVIEDAFPAGRPPLEKAGFFFTDAATVDKVERMKVCTCLNPLHTALAVFGCLLGYQKISDEMKDPDLVRLIERIGYREGLPVVVHPGILDPKEFIDTVLKVRIPNPFMPDTPQRIATDTSQKLAIRFGETIKNYQKQGLPPADLQAIPLVFAGWLRYLQGISDQGKVFELSPDPLLDKVCLYVKGLTGQQELLPALQPLLEDEKIFGVDLVKIGMAELVCRYFQEMLAGPGAVRRTLQKYGKEW